MKSISFSYNWNGKLRCECFSTIRIWNPSKYFVGDNFTVLYNGTQLGEVQLLEGKEFKLEKLTPFMAAIDTGLTLPETIAVIKKMYPSHNGTFGYYLFKWVLRDELPPMPPKYTKTTARTPGNAEEQPGTQGKDASTPTPQPWGVGLASCRLIKIRLEDRGELNPRNFAAEVALANYRERLNAGQGPEFSKANRALAYLIWMDAADTLPEWGKEDAFGEIVKGISEARAAHLGPLPAG